MNEHKRSFCGLCDDWIVVCGYCGNNTCNGGTGYKCDCKEAREIYQSVNETMALPIDEDWMVHQIRALRQELKEQNLKIHDLKRSK